jgi:hypothetical protein
MASMFDVKIPDLKKYFEKLEKAAAYAASAVSTDLAFEVRKKALEVLSGKYTIRNAAFVRSRLKVIKAPKGKEAFSGTPAVMASVGSPGFTGWTEMKGAPSRRKRTVTLNARGGNPKALLPARNRYRENQHYIELTDDPEPSRLAATINAAVKANPEARFHIAGSGFPDGIYAFLGRTKTSPATGRIMPRVEALQLLGRPPKETAAFDWTQKALDAIPSDFAEKSFKKNLDFYLKKFLS